MPKPNLLFRKLISYHNPYSAAAEDYRTIRTAVQLAMEEKGIKTILVTSPGMGEGKSLTSANLAVAAARAKLRTLYVDLDLRNPSGHLAFHLSNERGISHYLLGMGDLDFILCEYEPYIPSLYVIPSGPSPTSPAELIASSRMELFIQEVKQRFDLIILDSPSLHVSDPLLLSKKVDGCILVIDAKKTKRPQAIKAVEQLRLVNATLLGTILNRTRMKK